MVMEWDILWLGKVDKSKEMRGMELSVRPYSDGPTDLHCPKYGWKSEIAICTKGGYLYCSPHG